jgi:hypothetical protein
MTPISFDVIKLSIPIKKNTLLHKPSAEQCGLFAEAGILETYD